MIVRPYIQVSLRQFFSRFCALSAIATRTCYVAVSFTNA
ncbi:hypothetical protein [Polaromonas sp. CG9_12]|nr:hypothetical protein [Polaromonas sp. CG9_12]